MNDQARKLTRSREDRIIGGVAGGLASYFAIDPILVRVAFVASLALGGLGVIAYLALLVAVPVEGDPGEPVPLPTGPKRWLAIGGTVVLGIAVLATFDWIGPGWHFGTFWGLLWLLAIVGVVFAVRQVLRGGGGPGAQPPARTSPPPPAAAPTQNAPTAETAALPQQPAGAAGPGPARRSRVGETFTYLAIGLTALFGLFVLALLAAWATAEGGGVAVAAIVIAIGAGLVFAGIRGSRRAAWWLIAPALALALPMGAVAVADIKLEGGYGEETHAPSFAGDIPRDGYELAVGELTVDLRDYDWRPGETLRVPVEVGVGAAHVVVPDDVCVEADLTTKAGVLMVRGSQASGIDVERASRPDPEATPRLVVDGGIQLGAFEVVDSTRWELFTPDERIDEDWEHGSEGSEEARAAAVAACEAPETSRGGGREAR